MFSSILLTGAVILAPGPKDAKVEPAKLEGAWLVEAYTNGGKADPKRSGVHVTITSSKIEIKEEPGPIEYTVDAKKTPANIDLKAGKAPIAGIYEIKGDTLTLCFPHGGNGDRPTKFESPAGSGLILMVMKREKKK